MSKNGMKISLDCPFKWSSSIVGGRGGGGTAGIGRKQEYFQERRQNERQPVVFYLPDRAKYYINLKSLDKNQSSTSHVN